ncbi:MAG TPA: hypothetical protein VIV57_20565 [Anaeromyxobacter sp.]
MTRTRTFVLAEAASFATAALVHFGVLFHGYEHGKAGTAESVIAAVLVAGLAVTWIRPASTRAVGLAVQAFALLGTFVGLFTIAVGVGPRTAPDLAYHAGIVAVLVWGIVSAARSAPDGRPLLS